MKIGVITDIHGNVSALKAVLNELDKRQDIEHIYCLGDMIGIGPDTNEVLHILFARNDLSMITGNHDEAILALLKGNEYPVSHSHIKEHHQWVANNIDRDYILGLEHLPRSINITIEDKSILFTHYHIEKSKENEPIGKDPFSNIVEPSLSSLSKLFKDFKKHLICFGHHHPVHFFENKDIIFLNPGSLGCNPRAIAPFSIVQIENGKISVSLENVYYDNTKFLKSYELLQVPDRNILIKIFHGNQSIH